MARLSNLCWHWHDCARDWEEMGAGTRVHNYMLYASQTWQVALDAQPMLDAKLPLSNVCVIPFFF